MEIFRRQLGYYEAFVGLFHDYYNGDTTPGFLTTFQGKLKEIQVKETMRMLQKRHPNLRAKIIWENNKPYFEFSGNCIEVNFRKINRIDHDQALNELENEINAPFDTQDSLWRVLLLYGGMGKEDVHDLIITIHHSIIDGCTATRLIHDLMTILASLSKGEKPDYSSLPILKPIEVYYSKDFNWEMHLERDQCMIKNPPVSPTPWKFHGTADMKERKTRILNKVLSSEYFDKLKVICKKEQVTITGALNAAVASIFMEEQGEYQVELNMATPVDLCRRVGAAIKQESIGAMVSYIPVPLLINKKMSFWEIARQYTESLASSLVGFSKNPVDYDIDYLKRNHVDLNYQTEKPLAFSAVTNIGKVNLLEKYGHFKMLSFSFISAFRCGGVAFMLAVATFKGKLHFTFSYPEPLVNRDWFMKYVSKVINILEEKINI